ncbi:4F5 protein related disordered region [Popillia japonica]|uniref:4F5 protein related disordered region n=1 Tax=Popillia japonica TaxID=7064 RepID=A0AAW1L3E7_POPJA
MARGQQRLQSQAKAADKGAKLKKKQGHNVNEQKKAAQKALVHVCTVCKAQMPDIKTYRQHFENKHPKNEFPLELKDVLGGDASGLVKI